MIINCKSEEFHNNPQRRRVFVDGREIKAVWYLDTAAGFVKTYDVIEDADITATDMLTPELLERGKREGWDMPVGGAVSKTIRGQIELRPLGSIECRAT